MMKPSLCGSEEEAIWTSAFAAYVVALWTQAPRPQCMTSPEWEENAVESRATYERAVGKSAAEAANLALACFRRFRDAR